MTPPRPALRYHGGKWLLAPWIISHFPPHRIYCEPFAGAASVLLRKPRAYAEIYNDIAGDVVNLFKVLRDPDLNSKLQRLLELTPFARDEFRAAYIPTDEPVERARRILVRSYQGFGSASFNRHYCTGFRGHAKRSGSTPAHDWANYPAAIARIAKRLAGVTIENRNAFQLIPTHDSPETLFYIDPPYVHDTRNSNCKQYTHELTPDDHRALGSLLKSLTGMVVVSGYPSPLYDELFTGWHRVKRRASAGSSRVKAKRVEVLWINPSCWNRL